MGLEFVIAKLKSNMSKYGFYYKLY